MAENGGNGSHGFPRVSCYGHRGEQVDNGRKWPKNGRKMVEKSSPRLFGRKWIFAHLSPFPYYYIYIYMFLYLYMHRFLHIFNFKYGGLIKRIIPKIVLIYDYCIRTMTTNSF